MTTKQQLILSLAVPIKYHERIRKEAQKFGILPYQYVKLLWKLK